MEIKSAVRLGVCCIALAVILLFSGCATTQDFKPMTSGILATPGCKITAEDGSFTIESGQEFQPPFQMIKISHRYRSNSDLSGMVNFSADFLKDGAKRVRVTVPGRPQPLYGVLALFEISDLGTGPGARSYRIEIPQQYVDGATSGRVSVVYETYQTPAWLFPSWILWLSDQPF